MFVSESLVSIYCSSLPFFLKETFMLIRSKGNLLENYHGWIGFAIIFSFAICLIVGCSLLLILYVFLSIVVCVFNYVGVFFVRAFSVLLISIFRVFFKPLFFVPRLIF